MPLYTLKSGLILIPVFFYYKENMNSSTAIANASLLLIGAKELTDLDTDTTTTGRIAQRWYAHTRDSILRGYTWNFALRRQALSKDATGPDL